MPCYKLTINVRRIKQKNANLNYFVTAPFYCERRCYIIRLIHKTFIRPKCHKYRSSCPSFTESCSKISNVSVSKQFTSFKPSILVHSDEFTKQPKHVAVLTR